MPGYCTHNYPMTSCATGRWAGWCIEPAGHEGPHTGQAQRCSCIVHGWRVNVVGYHEAQRANERRIVQTYGIPGGGAGGPVTHRCAEPGMVPGATTVCGVCRASRRREPDGRVIVVPYGQVERYPYEPRKPRRVRLPADYAEGVPPTSVCTDCGMDDLPLDDSGRCGICAQIPRRHDQPVAVLEVRSASHHWQATGEFRRWRCLSCGERTNRPRAVGCPGRKRQVARRRRPIHPLAPALGMLLCLTLGLASPTWPWLQVPALFGFLFAALCLGDARRRG